MVRQRHQLTGRETEHMLWGMVEDRGAQSATVHGVTKSQTLLSDLTAATPLTRLCSKCPNHEWERYKSHSIDEETEAQKG